MAKKIKSACKKTHKKLLKLWGMILAFFLGISGQFTCLYGVIVEYGMPYAKFTINGKVQVINTGQAIPGILVSFQETSEINYATQSYTDGNGDYTIWFESTGAVDADLTLVFEDVDEAANGSYADKEVIVSITPDNYVDTTPGDDWDDGEGTRTVDVELSPVK
jgi:putative lipoprotein (rSAM/lipoprotein system)